MKLIDKDAVMAKIDALRNALKKCNPNPFGSIEEVLSAAQIEALDAIKDEIDTIDVKYNTPSTSAENNDQIEFCHIPDNDKN